MTRAERRHRLSLAKSEARRKLLISFRDEPTPENVGRQAATHNTCPCRMCTDRDPEHQRRIFSDLNKLHATC